MTKIKLKITLITQNNKSEYTTIGNYDEEKEELSYQEKTSIVTDVNLNLKNKVLTRDNKDLTMVYHFILNEETNNQIYLKDIDKIVDIIIKTTIYIYNENKIEIEYILIDSNEKVYYKIEY